MGSTFAARAVLAAGALFSILLAYSFVHAASTVHCFRLPMAITRKWTPSTGTSHFANVDESSCNGTTDYNSTIVVGTGIHTL